MDFSVKYYSRVKLFEQLNGDLGVMRSSIGTHKCTLQFEVEICLAMIYQKLKFAYSA